MSSCVLYHFAFDPGSRAVRLALGEARIEFSETLQTSDADGRPLTLCEPAAILGWLEERTAEPLLLPVDPAERAEVRRLLAWFDRRFTDEVNAVLLHERMEKPLLRLGPPEARALRAGREALKSHLAMMEGLLTRRDALAGRRISQADIVAAAHLSVLDYFGEVSWASWPGLKTWYMKLKSRPGFRPLLADRFPGVHASAWYADLDF
jgi:glutathione S-transferase